MTMSGSNEHDLLLLVPQLERAAKLAKEQDTRHLTLREDSLLLQLAAFVEMAVATTRQPVDNDDNGGRTDDSSPFDEIRQASPSVSAALFRAFLVLRDSCAGCRDNQDLLRSTGLPFMALEFAVDQACFACGAAPASAASLTPTPDTAVSAAAPAAEARATETSSTGTVRHAVRAALQFVCNFCVGNEDNQAVLWEKTFARSLMELVNGLKTDRELLSLAVSLIHNCCLAMPRGGGEGSGTWGGRQRLRQLTSDSAFCCLLMKVVPFDPTPSSTSVKSARDNNSDTADAAAEWIYILFCRFVQEGLLADVYHAVGIRAGGRSTERRNANEVNSGCNGTQRQEAQESVEARYDATSSTTMERVKYGVEHGLALTSGGIAVGGISDGDGDEDFFFPVTPEQLIMLTLTEIAAGDETITGGERPLPEQRQNCSSLATWLVDLLAAMPLNQSLAGHARGTTAQEGATASFSDKQNQASEPARYCGSRGGGGRTLGGDGEAESTRRRMREEARSAVLRALATLLAGCDGETRRRVVKYEGGGKDVSGFGERGDTCKWEPKTVSTTAVDEDSAPRAADVATERLPDNQENDGDNDDVSFGNFAGGSTEAAPCGFSVESSMPELPNARPEMGGIGIVPVCLRLLMACGGAAEPKAKVVGMNAGLPIGEGRRGQVNDHVMGTGVTGLLGLPAGRKVELLKVIGNACFRCKVSQDLIRETGALPLILNHCAVDGGSPLLREYAILAVRNLCEGNLENQASIAALQPQGCSPGMDQALADMGLEGRIDDDGKVRLDPRPRGV